MDAPETPPDVDPLVLPRELRGSAAEGVSDPLALPRELHYRSLPLRDDFPRSLALPAIVLAVSIGIGASFGEVRWAALSLLLLAAFVAGYFVPTRYRLDAAGVERRFLLGARRVPWQRVRRLYTHSDGVFLSPFAEPSRLDPFRGLFLRFAGNRERVLAFCERHVRRAC